MSGFNVVLLNSRRPFARSNSKGRALSSADRADCVRPGALPTKSFTRQKKISPKFLDESLYSSYGVFATETASAKRLEEKNDLQNAHPL